MKTLKTIIKTQILLKGIVLTVDVKNSINRSKLSPPKRTTNNCGKIYVPPVAIPPIANAIKSKTKPLKILWNFNLILNLKK